MKPTLADIIAETAAQEGLAPVDILDCRVNDDVDAIRFRAMWACRQIRPDVSSAQIGRAMHRDGSTIRSGLVKYEQMRAGSPQERADGDQLIAAFETGLRAPLTAEMAVLVKAALDRRGLHDAAFVAKVPVHVARARLALVAEACARTLGAEVAS